MEPLSTPYYMLITMIKRKLPFLLFFCFIFSFSSCDKEENMESRVAGAWQLASFSIDEQQQDMTGKNEIILLAENFVFKRYLTDENKYRIGGWSYAGNMLNISVDQPAAYYIESVNDNELSIKRHDFDSNGAIVKTVFNYIKVSEDLLP